MFTNHRVFESSEGNVWKYVFTSDNAVAEAVLYRYEDFYKRTVICCSTQSGCPVGCKFCGTGKKFIRDLTAKEIVQQIIVVLHNKMIYDVDEKGERFQIMFMSMGEPMLNWDNVARAIETLHDMFPNAELLISTMAPKSEDYGRLISLSKKIDKVPSSRDEGLFSCMARKTIPSHLSKLHRRLHSLYATQWAPRDTRRESTGEWSPFFPLKTRPDSPGESRMQP